MNLLHKIVFAVLAVICFMGMAVQGGGCYKCRSWGSNSRAPRTRVNQDGVNINALNAVSG